LRKVRSTSERQGDILGSSSNGIRFGTVQVLNQDNSQGQFTRQLVPLAVMIDWRRRHHATTCCMKLIAFRNNRSDVGPTRFLTGRFFTDQIFTAEDWGTWIGATAATTLIALIFDLATTAAVALHDPLAAPQFSTRSQFHTGCHRTKDKHRLDHHGDDQTGCAGGAG
jgi:hypothetical protein